MKNLIFASLCLFSSMFALEAMTVDNAQDSQAYLTALSAQLRKIHSSPDLEAVFNEVAQRKAELEETRIHMAQNINLRNKAAALKLQLDQIQSSAIEALGQWVAALAAQLPGYTTMTPDEQKVFFNSLRTYASMYNTLVATMPDQRSQREQQTINAIHAHILRIGTGLI